MIPNQNSGMETPSPEATLANRSESERRRSAETMPSGTDQETARIAAADASSMVAGQRTAMSVVTGFLVRQLSPRSPVKSWRM